MCQVIYDNAPPVNCGVSRQPRIRQSSKEAPTDIGTTHTWAALLPSITIGLVGGILRLFWPELVRSFVARHRPEIAQRFVDEDAHRRFIEFCGVVMLLIVVCACLWAAFVAR